jgi:hypothetical protein
MRPAAAKSDACWHAYFQMGSGGPLLWLAGGAEGGKIIRKIWKIWRMAGWRMADGSLTASTAAMLSTRVTRRVAGPITARLIRARPITARARPPPEQAKCPE